MIKRLLIVVLALLPIAAFGDVVDRDIVLANDGTLFTVESVYPADVANLRTSSERVLTLTIQKDGTSTTTAIPATLNGGWNAFPALAYDSDSSTLFVFWEAARNNFFSTDLYVCSYHDGAWGKATSLDSAEWAVRQNFHIAITRSTDVLNADGTKAATVPEITVHAVWWQQTGNTEFARYAMITMEHGNVSSIGVQNLSEVIPSGFYDVAPSNPEGNRELLRHPAVIETASHDSVDVVFGDMTNTQLRRGNIRPTVQGRLRVPTGRSGSAIPTPVASMLASASVNAITSSDSVTFYFESPSALNYLTYRNGKWTPERSIALSEKLTSDAAVNALRRMVSSQ